MNRPVRNERYFFFLKYGYFTALAAHILFGMIFFALDIYPLAWFNVVSVTAYLLAIWLLYKNYMTGSFLVVSSEVVIHAVVVTYMLGWESGFHYYFFTLMMAAAFHPFWSALAKSTYVALITAAYIWMYDVSFSITALSHVTPFTLNLLHGFNVIFSFIFIAYLAHIYAKYIVSTQSELESLASTDPLTGLYNRREFLKLYNFEYVKIQRTHKPMSLIMMDIDNFKLLNSSFGHQCGDSALVEVSQCFRDTIREQDHLSRWGGEEFVLLLPDTDLIGAQSLAHKLKEAVAALEFFCEANPQHITITLSVGQYSSDETFDQFLSRIDLGLRLGKESGKNRVMTV